MEIIRTTTLKINLPIDIARSTIQQWTNVLNYISNVAFVQGGISNTVQLHKLVYSVVRTTTGLSAQVVQSAIRVVAGKYAGARTTKTELRKPIYFREQAVVLQGGEKGRDFSFTHSGLSVWTVDGRKKKIEFRGEPRLQEYLASWKLGDARLFIRKNNVYLSVSFKKEVENVVNPNNSVVGVDRGINYLAVVTDGKKQEFFAGNRVKHRKLHYSNVRSSLQRKKAQRNTRSIRRVEKRLSGRESRFMRDVNHCVSKKIVLFAKTTGSPTIALEALEGIRDRSKKMRKTQRKQINSWAFYQLSEFIEYKSAFYGFELIEIDSRNTSRGCSRCGYVEANNRHGHDFTCKACGYRLHADLNASRNIRLRGILARQALGEIGLSVNQPLSTSSSELEASHQPCVDGN